MNAKEMQKTDTSGLKNKMVESTQVGLKKNTFSSLLDSMKDEIKKALPKHITVERIMRVAQSAYSRDTKIQQCDPMTIISGIVQASQLGLEVNTQLGHAYLIPFNNKKTGKMEAQFQMGYKGVLSLAYRSEQYKMIGAYSVYVNDNFEYELGIKQKLVHKPAPKPDGEPIYYYAIYKTIKGGEGFYVMSREQVQGHASKYSQAYQKGYNSPWKSDFDAMAKKTVLKQLLNYAPKSIEYERQSTQDGTIKRDIDADMTIIPNEFDFESLEDNK